ncbi:hypothetical protein [Pseudomonas phage vB_PsaM_M1]|nr:hypothetical protein [Pseudomonas phage vB_PsaM_M1]
MSKCYLFTNDSYYESRGCSCCESYLFEVYNSDETNCNLGSAYNRAHCYLQAIATESGIEYWEDVADKYREMEYTELKKLATEMGIKVEIIG